MDGISLDVIGNRVILDNLDALEMDVLAKLDEAMNAAADVGKQVAQSLARVDTGEMRSKVYTDVRDQQIILGDDSDHAVYNELGTSKMSAQPFLVPGAVAAGDELKKQLEGVL
jgi:HK97 gp10 family phage protein